MIRITFAILTLATLLSGCISWTITDHRLTNMDDKELAWAHAQTSKYPWWFDYEKAASLFEAEIERRNKQNETINTRLNRLASETSQIASSGSTITDEDISKVKASLEQSKRNHYRPPSVYEIAKFSEEKITNELQWALSQTNHYDGANGAIFDAKIAIYEANLKSEIFKRKATSATPEELASPELWPDSDIDRAMRVFPKYKNEKFRIAYAQRNNISEKKMERVKSKAVQLGDSIPLMYAVMGFPEKENKTVNAYGVYIQHIYSAYYIYTDNGVVTSWQTR